MNSQNKQSRPKIAFFSDSRGWHKGDPSMQLFWERLSSEYEVVSFAQPYKWTTILDFISLVRDGILCPSDFDHIVLWAGVVDFSPRPIRSCSEDLLNGAHTNQVTVNHNRTKFYNRRINAKAPTVERLIKNRFLDGLDARIDLSDIVPAKHEIAYGGELTASLYSQSFLDQIAAELNSINNLIFIDTCDIHPDWDGNFMKGRPRNISVVSEYNRILVDQLTCPIVQISDWSHESLRRYTIDSIHLTQEGSDVIEARLRTELNRINSGPSLSSGNFVLTATDENFFPSTLMLIESIYETSSGSVDGVCVLDIGMASEQREMLQRLRGVYVVDYQPKDIAQLKALPFDFFEPQTYGFKSYLTVKAPHLIAAATGLSGPFNLMYVDGGIFLNHSIAPIFEELDQEGIFCVDHDDCHDLYGENPFFLLNILSPKLFDEGFELLDHEKLCKPYIKAGFFGYRSNGKWQKLIDEYWDLCLSTTVLALPKPVQDNAERMWYRNNTSIAQYVVEKFGHEKLENLLNYSNGRQDQTALSYLIAKYNVKIHNSREFNFTVSTNLGKSAAIGIFKRLAAKHPETSVDPEEFWQNKNENTNRLTKANLLPVPHIARQSASTLHRGALAQKDQIKYAGRLLNRARNIRNDTFILLGNGPSLGDVDLHSLSSYHTMVLNAAYRAYERMNFWPKYFGCFDALVCGHHSERFKELIRDSEIEKFFFINYNEQKKAIFPEGDIQTSPRFQPINFVERTVPEKDRDDILSVSFNPFIDMLTSGSNSVQTALLLGYRKIILLGCDANYTEVVDGAKQENQNKNRIVMERTPEQNVNYWFSDYQQEGDRFNLPNTAGCQLPAWGRLARSIQLLNVNAEIINCSPISRIEDFKKMPLEDALDYFNKVNVEQILEPKQRIKKPHSRIIPVTAPGSMARQQGLKDAPGTAPMPMSPTTVNASQLASRLLLDPVEMLPRVEAGGDLAFQVQQLLAADGPAAAHLRKAMAWARAAVTETA